MKADLHVHTSHSDDGRQTVEELVKRCTELGIKAVAITDHNTMAAHSETKSFAGESLIIVPAVEITAEGGHILAYGIEGEVPRGLSVAETIEKIHRVGGIAVAPHPYRRFSGLGEDNVRENHFDAIEVINGRSRKGVNDMAKRLAESLHIPQVGGSDAHNVKSIGQVYTELPDRCKTWQDILEAVRSGECSAEGKGMTSSMSVSNNFRNFSKWLGRGFRRM
jgi:predicted metal-dependent phosphoesterase TrpH